MFEKAKIAAKKGAKKTKSAAKQGTVKTKELTKKSTTTTKEIARRTTDKTKSIARKGSAKTKVISQKGKEATKTLAKKTGIATKEFTKRGAVATAEISQKFAQLSTAKSGELLAFMSQEKIVRWIRDFAQKVTDDTSTIYDKALDAEYIRTHIGGGYHRFYDGGHDLLSAWQKVREASPDDTLTQEVIGYSSAIWKDLITQMGIPVTTLNKASFDVWADRINDLSFGIINKSYLLDLWSFDVAEITFASLGAIGAIFCLKKQDQQKLSEILSVMGVQSIISANPIMGIFMIAVTAYAYFIKKTRLDTKAMLRGGIVAAVSASIFTILGFPLLVELMIVIVLTSLLKKQILNNDELIFLIQNNAKLAREKGNKLINTMALRIEKVASKSIPNKSGIPIIISKS